MHLSKEARRSPCSHKLRNPKNEIVWNNRKILIGKKPVFYQTWYDAGITKISDILNQNQKFLKWHEFVTKFNLNVPFTTYYGLVNAIPKDWKAILTNPIPNVTHANTTVNSLRTSSIYSSLLNTVFVPPTAETKILRHGFTKATIKNDDDVKDLQFSVPQGSVPGPILYSLYISLLGDIVRHDGLEFHLYADDTQLYFAFRPITAEQQPSLACIEARVSHVDSWLVRNKLKINTGKPSYLF